MAQIKYFVDQNFNNQISYNFIVEDFNGSIPISASGGRLAYDSVTDKLYIYDGGWKTFTPDVDLSFGTLNSGGAVSKTFIVSTGTTLSYNNNGIINSNQFFGSGIVPVAKGGTGATGFAQNGILFHVNGNFSSNSGLYFDSSNFLLGIGNTGWVNAGGPTALVHIGAGSVNYPQIKLESTTYTTNLAGNKGAIEYTHSSGLSFIDGGSTRRMISYFGASVTGFTGVLPLSKGGTGRSAYNFGSLVYASGNELAPYTFGIGNVQALMITSSGSQPTFLIPGSSGSTLMSNGSGFVFDVQSSTAALLTNFPQSTSRNTVRATGNLAGLTIDRSGNFPITPIFDVKNDGTSLFRVLTLYTELTSPRSSDFTFTSEINNTILQQDPAAVGGGTLYLPDGNGTLAKISNIPVVYGVSGITVVSGIFGGYQAGLNTNQDTLIFNNIYTSGKFYAGGSPTGALQITSLYDTDTGFNFDAINGIRIYASGQEIALFKSASGINTVTLQNQVRVLGDMYVSGIIYTPSGALGGGGSIIIGGSGGVSDHSLLSNLSADDHSQYIYNRPINSNRNKIMGTGSFSLLTIDRSGSFPSQNIFSVQNNGNSVFNVFNTYSELNNLRTTGVYFNGPLNPTTLGQDPNAINGGSLYLPDGNGTLALLNNIPYIQAGTGIIINSGTNTFVHLSPNINQRMNFTQSISVTGNISTGRTTLVSNGIVDITVNLPNAGGTLALTSQITSGSGILAGSGISLSTNGTSNVIHVGPIVPRDLSIVGSLAVTGIVSTDNNFSINGSGSLIFASGSNTTRLFTEATGSIGLKLPSYNGTLEIANSQVSPSQITSDQNDYYIGPEANFIRINADQNYRSLTGISGGYAGRRIHIKNAGSTHIIIRNENVSSLPQNRILTPTSFDIVLRPRDIITLIYDGFSGNWELISGHENYLNDPRFCVSYFEDFNSGSANSTAGTAGVLGMAQTNTGTGAGGVTLATGYQMQFGSQRISTGTIASGRCILSPGVIGSISTDDNCGIDYETRISIPSLGVVGQDFCLMNGSYYNNNPLPVSRAIGFFYGGSSTGNWQAYVANTSPTFIDTGIPANTGWIKLRYKYKSPDSSGNTTVSFEINDTQVGIATTNLPPTGAANLRWLFATTIQKLSGTTPKFLDLDYQKFTMYRTTERF